MLIVFPYYPLHTKFHIFFGLYSVDILVYTTVYPSVSYTHLTLPTT